MNAKSQAWISATTREQQAAVKQMAVDLDTINCKAKGLIAVDGNVEKQTDELAKLRAKGEVLAARLGRARTALYTALVEDAKAYAVATDKALGETTATLHAERLAWAEQCRLSHSKLAGSKMATDSSFWPQQLRDRESEVRRLRAANGDANRTLGSIDASRLPAMLQAATPVSGRYATEADFRNAAAQILPEIAG